MSELGWEAKITLEELIKEMVKEDSELAKKEQIMKNQGFTVNASMETPPNF